MKTYFTYDKDNLIFVKSNQIKNKVWKWRIVSILFMILFSYTLVSFKESIDVKQQLLNKIAEQKERINFIREPLKEDTYVEDLYKNIGFKLSNTEYERFSYLALKYKKQIEEAHVPATMVWYVAYKESRFNSEAKNPESSSCGLYQFINSTWNSMCKLNGENTGDRFNEEKQVRIMLVYVNYLYNRYHSWEKVMQAFRGFEPHYKTGFLFK